MPSLSSTPSHLGAPDPILLAARIKALAKEMGFARVGISGVDLGPDEAHLRDWLAQGLYGSMEWMARHVGAFPVGERVPGRGIVLAIVQADRDHAHGAGHEVLGARALVAVARHPVHRTVEALRQPIAQVRFVRPELHARDAHALEAHCVRDVADPGREQDRIGWRCGRCGRK